MGLQLHTTTFLVTRDANGTPGRPLAICELLITPVAFASFRNKAQAHSDLENVNMDKFQCSKK